MSDCYRKEQLQRANCDSRGPTEDVACEFFAGIIGIQKIRKVGGQARLEVEVFRELVHSGIAHFVGGADESECDVAVLALAEN